MVYVDDVCQWCFASMVVEKLDEENKNIELAFADIPISEVVLIELVMQCDDTHCLFSQIRRSYLCHEQSTSGDELAAV